MTAKKPPRSKAPIHLKGSIPELSTRDKLCVVHLFQHRCTQIDAYIATFGEKSKREATSQASSKFFNRQEVQEYLAELRSELRDRAMVSAEEHVVELRSLRDQAVAAGQFNAAVTAETNVGKVTGLYTDRQEGPKQKPSLVIRRPGDGK